MFEDKPAIVVTGISGALGLKLLPQLSGYHVTGVDIKPPQTVHPLSFVQLDLGLEDSCRDFFLLMREIRPVAVIHLAFVGNSVRSEINDPDRMWQINVGGTARVFEAVTEVNRDEEIIKKFIFVSCVFAYGFRHSKPVTEDHKLAAGLLPIAIQKMESDNAIQQRAPSARGCSVFVLRPALFVGAGTSNYLLEALRGTPGGRGKLGLILARRRNLVPFILPWGKKYLESPVQFIHPGDVARLITFILRKLEPESRRLTVLNVAARGALLALSSCTDIAKTKMMRVPGQWVMRQLMLVLWKSGISAIPPETVDYLLGTPVLDVARLREFLGPYSEEVIRYTNADALAECFTSRLPERAETAAAASPGSP